MAVVAVVVVVVAVVVVVVTTHTIVLIHSGMCVLQKFHKGNENCIELQYL